MFTNYKEHFQDLYSEYQGMVFSLCRAYMGGDSDLAKDLTQEVFIKVWKALPDFKGKSSIKTWIYRISVNTCLLHIRDDKHSKSESLNESQINVPDDENNTSQPFKDLYLAINKLKDVDRVIILMVLDELKYSEISSIVGIAEGALRVRIHRIKQQLNEMIKNDE